MSPTDDVDVIVIGAGPAGENVAGRCADGGLTTVIVERELVGGECSYWGCIPSKTLIRPGDVIADARRVPGAAEAVTGTIDVAAAFARRDKMISNLDDAGQLPWLAEKKIELFRGAGRLTGTRMVEVTAGDGTTTTITARRAVVLATGSSAAIPPVEGLAEAAPWNNRDITGAGYLPRRLIVLGGGAVGCEMAQAFRRLGSEQVTVLEIGDRLLAAEEPFAAREVRAAFEAEGITVLTEVHVSRVARATGGGAVTVQLADGRQIEADEIVVAAGRRPRTTDLGMDAVGLEPGKPIEVDDALRAVGVDGGWLYAVGDCNGRVLLTHVGKYQARIAADVILGKDVRDQVSRDAVPRVTFTDPQVCAVGLTEKQARDRGCDVRVVSYGTGDVAGAGTRGKGITGTSALVVDRATQCIVGATFTGPDVQELLHSATIAIVGKVAMQQLWHAVPTFPTVSEVWLRLLEAYGL